MIIAPLCDTDSLSYAGMDGMNVGCKMIHFSDTVVKRTKLCLNYCLLLDVLSIWLHLSTIIRDLQALYQ